MLVTVCELRDDPPGFAEDWQALVEHVRVQSSQLVLLPEMPFCPWFALTRRFEPRVWQAAVAAHTAWLERLPELAPAVVLATRPLDAAGRRINQAFAWAPGEPGGGLTPAHEKYYLPEDEGFWEAPWYQRGSGEFTPLQIGDLSVGFLVCTELWFMQRARVYGQQGIHVLAVPRATGKPTVEKWLTGGRAAAVISGAYCLSSNHAAGESQAVDLGGQGWIVGPDGEVLALTSRQEPFVTRSIDLAHAARAKTTYPRYVRY